MYAYIFQLDGKYYLKGALSLREMLERKHGDKKISLGFKLVCEFKRKMSLNRFESLRELVRCANQSEEIK